MATRVGFIGLGRMGQPMCRHILKAGLELTVFDLDPNATQPLIALGARAAGSAGEVARASDVVLVMVTDDRQVRAVVTEALAAGTRGTVIAICSSVHPQTCRELAEMASASGQGLVDAPVARGQRGAEAGTLTVFVGGAAEHVTACRPVLEAFSQMVCHMGPVGAGQITKTCNNLLHWAEIVACYEALSLGESLGLSPGNLRSALLAGSADSRTLRELELVKLTWPEKDMATALALADERGMPVPLMRHVRELIKGITVQDLRALVEDKRS